MSIKVSVSKRIKTESNEQTKKLSREEWRKAKELEEARKAGTAPAAVDEEGKDINPHIPQYISTVPWYYNSDTPTLKHQRPQVDHEKSHSSINEWYQRGVNKQSVAKKFRKGACTNCGAMGHEKKNCFERPRKLEAKFNNRNIAPDDFVQKQLDLSYDGKRDRWAGYDPAEHKLIIEEYERIEEAKRKLRTDKLNDGTHDDNQLEKDIDNDDEDEDKYVDEIEMVGTKVDNKQRITVRNLRIREDTAKYLYNLDQNSAYYDPKTRAMRDNPHKNTNKVDPEYKGENFVRFTGDTVKHSQAQLFAWEVGDKGVDINLLAEPTKLELLQKEFDKKKDVFKSQIKQAVFNQYGGEEYLGSNPDAVPKSLLLAQTEDYVEYSREGKVIKGNIKPVIRSKYPEDQYNNNHTTVWGSYWKDGQWGYKCCLSTIKNSFCIGNKSVL